MVRSDSHFEVVVKAVESLRKKKEEENGTKKDGVDGEALLDKLARTFVLNALYVDLGWNPKVGERVSVPSLIAQLKLDRRHGRFIGALLTQLEQNSQPAPALLTRLPQTPEAGLLDFEWSVSGVVGPSCNIGATLKDLQTELLLEYPSLLPELNLLNLVGPRLCECMRGHANSDEILCPPTESFEYPYSLLPYNQQSLHVQEQQVAYLKAAVGQYTLTFGGNQGDQDNLTKEPETDNAAEGVHPPWIRILEIGTNGSPSLTIPLIRHLISVCKNNSASLPDAGMAGISYTYSDRSSIALGRAKQTLETEFPDIKLEFEVLVPEEEPPALDSNQTGLVGKYNVVVGLNSMHVVKYLDDSLVHLRALVQSDGMLALGELFSLSPWLGVAFGVGDSWWGYGDKLRTQGLGPLLSAEQWKSLLPKFGFMTVYAAGNPEARFGTILATKLQLKRKEKKRNSPIAKAVKEMSSIWSYSKKN